MLEVKVLIREAARAPNRGAARAVAVDKVAALAHEARDDAVEFAALVPLREVGGGVLGLARAELAEVLGTLWGHVLEELDKHAAERGGAERDV